MRMMLLLMTMMMMTTIIMMMLMLMMWRRRTDSKIYRATVCASRGTATFHKSNLRLWRRKFRSQISDNMDRESESESESCSSL